MPYAYGAKIEHEFDTDHLNVWLTFRHPMDQDVKPAHNLWTLTVDDVEKAISASAWQDEYTLLLESDAVVTYPNRVLLAYDGPSGNLQTTWGKDWEPWGDALSTDIGKGLCFVDRGDPASYDFVAANFTKDNNWHDLDLSGIVADGAKAVLLHAQIVQVATQKTLSFRKNGNTRVYNVNVLTTQVGSISITADLIVALDANGVIEYKLSAGTWPVINVTVKGWWF